MASSLAALEADRSAALETARLAEARLAIATQRVTVARPLVASGLIATEELRRREESALALQQLTQQVVQAGRANTLAPVSDLLVRIEAAEVRLREALTRWTGA